MWNYAIPAAKIAVNRDRRSRVGDERGGCRENFIGDFRLRGARGCDFIPLAFQQTRGGTK
jgi:hypothetical protein